MIRVWLSYLIVVLLISGCKEQPTPFEQEWVNADFTLEQSRIYIAQHVTLVSAKEWRRRDFSAQTALEWIEIDIPADEARLWIKHGMSPIEAKRYTKLGIRARVFPKWESLKLSNSETVKWRESGLTFEEIRSAVQLGFTFEAYNTLIHEKRNYNPTLYQSMGSPMYAFYPSCQAVLRNAMVSELHQPCKRFTTELDRLRFMGLLLDRQSKKDSDLLLDYLEGLRALNLNYLQLVDSLVVKQDRAIEQNNSALFTSLFDYLPMAPTEAEIAFIEREKLNFDGNKRYQSYENADYWQDKAKREHEARMRVKAKEALLEKLALEEQRRQEEARELALRKKQQAKERAERAAYEQEQARIRLEQLRLKQAKMQTIQSRCAPFIEPDMLSNKRVLIVGSVIFEIEERGSKFYTVGVYDKRSQSTYLIRDPKAQTQFKRHQSVQWIVKTLGRRSRVSKVGESYTFDKKGELRFETSKYESTCQL